MKDTISALHNVFIPKKQLEWLVNDSRRTKDPDIWGKSFMFVLSHTIDHLRKGGESGVELFSKLEYSNEAMYIEKFRKP